MDDQSLRIRQWRPHYCLPRGNTAAMGRRLDRLLRNRLPGTLQQILAPQLAMADGVYLLRRLTIDLDLDLGLEEEQIVHCLASRFSQSLLQAMAKRGEQDADDGVYFPDRSTYLAHFLLDLAGGTAWRAWYYREFEGLRSLPPAMAIRTAVLDDPGQGQSALLELAPAELARVLAVLTDGEAHRIVTQLARQSDSSTAPQQRQLNRIIDALAEGSLLRHGGARTALGLYLRAMAPPSRTGGGPLLELCQAVVALHEAWARRHRSETLLEAVIQGRWSERFGLSESSTVSRLHPLMKLAADRRRQAVDGAARGDPKRFTPYGGAFMLLPLLLQMPMQQALSTWPQPEGACKHAVVRLLLLALCLGGERSLMAFRDPLLRDVTGVAPGFTWPRARQWLDRITRRQLQHCSRIWAAWRLSRPDNTPVKWVHLSHAKRRLAVAYIADRKSWVLIRGCRPSRMRRFMAALEEILPEGTGIATAAESENPTIRKDLDFLALPADLRCQHGPHDLLCCAAQALLRDFSARLPGFAGSSAAHLFRNFLDVGARLQTQAEQMVVQLERPPLNVILAMTGLPRARYRLPWRDRRSVALFPEG